MAHKERLIEKILALLMSGTVDIEFHHLPSGIWGGNDFDNPEEEDNETEEEFLTILISKRLSENSKIRTLIHEALHLLYRSRSEKWVRAREEETYGALTKLERQRLRRILHKAEKAHNNAILKMKRREAQWAARSHAKKRKQKRSSRS